VVMSRNREVSSLTAAHANHACEVPLPFQDLDQDALLHSDGQGGGGWKRRDKKNDKDFLSMKRERE